MSNPKPTPTGPKPSDPIQPQPEMRPPGTSNDPNAPKPAPAITDGTNPVLPLVGLEPYIVRPR